MPRIRNLAKLSSGSYVLRIFVPTDLIPRFGRKEITRSLRTNRLPEAERLATLLKAGILRIFEMARQNSALTAADFDSMAKAYFGRIWAQAQADLAFRRLGPSDKPRYLDGHAEAISLIGRWIRTGDVQNARPYFDGELTAAASEAGVTAGTHEHNLLCKHVLSVRADYHRRLFDCVQTGALELPAIEGLRHTSEARPARADETLSVLVEKFIAEWRGAWARKTVLKHTGNLTVCAQIIGRDKAVATITKGDVRNLKDVLAQLPANWSKLYPSKSPLEAATESKAAGRSPMTPGAANAYLASLSSFLSWCVKQGYIEDNPALKIKLPETVRAEDKRNPFTPQQLNTIFHAPLYTGMRSQHYWAKPGNFKAQDARYWIPLIALFSGMRLGEIINLLPSDVRDIDGIPCMDIRRAKTKAGERKVPVHPDLISLGFLSYVAKASADTPIFAGFNEDAFSKFFGRFLGKLGITDEKLVFHSFRHTFSDAMRGARIDSPLAKALIGHADGTVTGIYGNGYPMANLAEAMAKIRYEGLDLAHLQPEAEHKPS